MLSATSLKEHRPSLFFAVSSPDVGGTAWQYGVFGQDEYQINSRLTLNYGLRWQILPGFHEDGGNLANFDQRNNSIVVPEPTARRICSSKTFRRRIWHSSSRSTPATSGIPALPCTNYITASQDHLPQSLRNIYMRNFQPRVSIAWRPFNDTKTVIRAGFGIFTMTNLGPLSFNNSGNPTSALHTYTNQLALQSGTASSDSVSQHSATHCRACSMAAVVSIRESIRTIATRKRINGT